MLDLDIHAAAIAAGDAAAFACFLRDAERPLRGALTRYAASVDTEAILQEAMLRVWQLAPRFTPDGKPNALLRYAARIASNLAIDAARRVREQPLDPLDAGAQPVSSRARPIPLLRQLIQRCRNALPKQPARALGARLDSAGGEPDTRLAALVRMQPNTFLQNVTRARRLLADCLRKAGVEPALLAEVGA